MSETFQGDPMAGLGSPALRHVLPYTPSIQRYAADDPSEWENSLVGGSLLRYLLSGGNSEQDQQQQVLIPRHYKTPKSRINEYRSIIESPNSMNNLNQEPVIQGRERDLYLNELMRYLRGPSTYDSPIPNQGDPSYNKYRTL